MSAARRRARSLASPGTRRQATSRSLQKITEAQAPAQPPPPWGPPPPPPLPPGPPTVCPPNTGSIGISIKDAALYTNDPTVELTITAPAGATGLRVSNDGGFAAAKTRSIRRGAYSWHLRSSGPERLPRTGLCPLRRRVRRRRPDLHRRHHPRRNPAARRERRASPPPLRRLARLRAQGHGSSPAFMLVTTFLGSRGCSSLVCAATRLVGRSSPAESVVFRAVETTDLGARPRPSRERLHVAISHQAASRGHGCRGAILARLVDAE